MTHRASLPLGGFTLLVTVAIAFPATAQARSSAQRLSELRARLHAYDVRPDGTAQVIEALGELAGEAAPREADEARFLRAIATADLMLIARRRRDEGLVERLALAYGTQPDELEAAIRTDLRAMRREPYLATVEDALAALAPSEDLVVPPPGTAHTRRQATFFARVFDALVRTDDPTTLLAQLAPDPCGESSECPPAYARFGEQGRRAIAGMTALHAILQSMERTAELGDPFTAALAREVLVDTVVLRSISMTPHDWATSVTPVDTFEGGAPLDVDAVVVVGRDHVRAGWKPEVLWGVRGRPTLLADGPQLGSEDEVRIRIAVTPGSYVRPIRDLAARLEPAIRGASRVALVVEPGVEAHVLSRVIVSLAQAEVRLPTVLAIAKPDGTIRGVPFETVGDDDSLVGVFVRLGGFSAWAPGGRVSLPRQRTAQGWAFDFDGLARATRARARVPLTLSFMSSVDADLVVRVALRLASVNRPLRLVIP